MAPGQLTQAVRLLPSDELALWIAAYLDDCALRGLRAKTLRFYSTNLERFRWWCETNHVPLDPGAISRAHIREFLRYLQTAEVRWGKPDHPMSSRPAGERTVHAYWRVLHVFFGWLVGEEVIAASPCDRLKGPKRPKDEPRPFSDGELARLAAALKRGEGMLADRNRALVATLLDTGLRASEAAGLQIRHVDLASGRMWVATGKGGKSREVFAGAAARRPLRRWWLRWRRALGDGADGPFFTADDGEALTPQGIHHITTRLGEAAGVFPSFPHRFRHTYATNAVKCGIGILELQRLMGHSDLSTLQVYVKLAGQDLEAASRAHSPLDTLKLGL